jgi:hypothetical protein
VLLLFGVPRGGSRQVGARFAATEAAIARWIARHRGLSLLAAEAGTALSRAALLPEWQLGADGAPKLAVIPAGLWHGLREQLEAVTGAGGADAAGTAGGDAGATAADETNAEAAAAAALQARRLALAAPLWAAMAVGDVVLAPEFDRHGEVEGWWEAVILAVAEDEDGDGSCTVCWLDEPETGFRRRRVDLAPLHPSRRSVSDPIG